MLYGNLEEIVGDIETDGFKPTKIWCACAKNVDTGSEWSLTSYEKMISFFSDESKVFIFHNGLSYDKPVLERILGIKIKAKFIDTLGLSWYLYPTRHLHGLESWGEYFGIPKPLVDDWENLSIEEYVHRCEEDVKINVMLWEKIKSDLVKLYKDKDYMKAVDYINFKMECAALQEKSKWKLNVVAAEDLVQFFNNKIEDSKNTLLSVMPKVAVKAKKKRPAKPFKKDGSLSASGLDWKQFTEERGYPFDYAGEIEYIKGYAEPNGGSHSQVKDWLFSLGWNPTIYAYKRNKETGEVKKIEQIKDKDTGELCADIKRLIEVQPELQVLEDLSVLSHRKSVVEGFLADVDEDGFVTARIQGFTNTLRFRHKVCLNIPSLRKPYGKELRGLLMASSEDAELMGADMSSLEDRTKQHYMWDYDPDYVKEMMTPDFDPHLLIAGEAGLVTEEEIMAYKKMDRDGLSSIDIGGNLYFKKTIAQKRHAGKSTNYSSTYGAGGATIARAAGVSEQLGKKLHTAYWKKNWSLKKIAEDCLVKQELGVKWLWNPVAKMWYWLKADKDKFSTLNQGTGTYCFDMWIKEVLSKRYQLTAQFHDEGVWEIKVGYRTQAEKLLKDAVARVNEQLKLNRDLDVGVQFGRNYSEIH